MNEIPFLELHLKGIEQHVRMGLMSHANQLSSEMEKAVEGYFSEDNLSRVIREKVCHEIKRVMEKEIEHFFHYGEGRKVIQRQVVERLTNELKDLEDM